MRRQWAWRYYIAALVAADAALLVHAFALAAVLRDAIDLLPYQPYFDPRHYGSLAGAVIPGLLGIFWLRGAYARQTLLGGPEEYSRVFSGCTYGVLLVIASSYLYGAGPLVSRSWLLLFWVLAFVLVSAGRFAMRRVAYRLRRYGWFVRRVLVGGASDQGLAIAQQLHGPYEQGVDVIGFLDDYLSTGTCVSSGPVDQSDEQVGQFAIVGHLREARSIAALHECDLLIVVPAALSWESQRTIAQLGETNDSALEVRLAPTQYDLTAVGVEAAPLGYIPLLRLQPARITGVDAMLRATIDYGLTAVLLVVTAPALSWAVVVAWLKGVRPMVVRWQVLGQGGRPITLRLLNPRVTDRLLLRGIPALLSVLTGQVALVGPRPVPVTEQAEYERWIGVLASVKPGLTGPWRLADPDLSTAERATADVWWVRNWSIWQHLFVLVQTARRSLRRGQKEQELVRWEMEHAGGRHRGRALAT
jgi:lipopolysaccharide/colanic/teichoic acid biosynthesis glycosyltransferase